MLYNIREGKRGTFKMTVLDCSATNCFYNKEKRCSKGGIQVEGRTAEKTSETCCGSFKERGESMSNSMLSASSEIDVSCDACNCKFNRDSKCSANHIISVLPAPTRANAPRRSAAVLTANVVAGISVKNV